MTRTDDSLSSAQAHERGWQAYQSKDYAEAVRWYRIAAVAGFAKSQHNLGVMYARGEGVATDEGEAFRWFGLAAHQGFAASQYNMGLMYEQGVGTGRSLENAFAMYRMAADNGDADAAKAVQRFRAAAAPLHPSPNQADADAALRDLGKGLPLPGLPNLGRPVYVDAGRIICVSADTLGNPNIAMTLMIRSCVATKQTIRVTVLRPLNMQDELQARIFKMVRIVAEQGEISDATVATGWIYIKDLRN